MSQDLTALNTMSQPNATIPPSSPNVSPKDTIVAPAMPCPGVKENANPRCRWHCGCVRIIRRTDYQYYDFCIEYHLPHQDRED
jgi:hypothetical protein